MAVAVNLDNYDVDPEAFHLRDLLQGILDRVESVYTSYGVPLPARKYWTMGSPAVDCEQVAVYFIQMYLGAPGDEASAPQKCNTVRSAVVGITIARQIPIAGQTGRTPSGTKIQNNSEISAVDSWILMESVNLFDQWEEGGYGPGVIATLVSNEPSGGYQTITLQLTMAVP